MAKTPIDLYLLIIAPNSEMLLENSTELPIITGAVSLPIDKKDLESKLRNKFTEKGLKDLDFNISRFKICYPTDKSFICVILIVSDEEKTNIEKNTKFIFRTTYEDDKTDEEKRSIPLGLVLSPKSINFFVKFQYDTKRSGNPLDKCIKNAPKPKKDESTKSDPEVVTYKFYRPIYPLGLFQPRLYPYGITRPYVISPFTTPIGSPVRSDDSPIYPRSDRFSGIKIPSPVVPRSPRSPGSSPKVPRMRRGGYYDKYMKYKLKYLKLKAGNF